MRTYFTQHRIASICFIAVIICATLFSVAPARTLLNINSGWKFIFNSDNSSYSGASFNDASWDDITLPSTFKYENEFMPNPDWHGVCWYRRTFTIPAEAAGNKVFLKFEGAMTVAQVYVNGDQLMTHYGGYLPFVIDITENVTPGSEAVIAVRLDNQYKADVPPERPGGGQNGFDFLNFGGMYRDVCLLVTDNLHVTEPVIGTDDATGSLAPDGGVFVRASNVSTSSASLQIRTIVLNESGESKSCELKTTIVNRAGEAVATMSATQSISAGQSYTFNQTGTVASPSLWSPTNPYLYRAVTEVIDNGTVVDTYITRFGLRSISFSNQGFFLNGEHVMLLGLNRHQSFPYIGYAVPGTAEFRDIKVLKEMGCNFIRLSHYPQSPAVMDALDSLGIMCWVEAPTWWGDPGTTSEWTRWLDRHFQNIREMIRRDRNHPSVITWAVGINEGGRGTDFEDACEAAAKDEYPGCYTTSGRNYTYDGNRFDIYGGNHFDLDWVPSSMPGGRTVGYINSEFVGHTCITARFSNEIHQKWHATRFERQVNLHRQRDWISGGSAWCAYDYNSRFGSASYEDYCSDPTCRSIPECEADKVVGNGICYHGVADLFRIPKFAYYFYQSQSAADDYDGSKHPMVNIQSLALYDMPSTQEIKVFSNCEQVELFVNGTSVGTRSPDNGTNLAHPPFTFENVSFTSPGVLKADGKINGSVMATHTVRRSGSASKISLWSDTPTLLANGADIARVVVSVDDANDQRVHSAENTIQVSVSGPARVICGSEGPQTSSSVKVQAGALAFLVQAGATEGEIVVTATASGLDQDQLTINATTDGRPQTSIQFHEREKPLILFTRKSLWVSNLDKNVSSRIMIVAMNGRIIKDIKVSGTNSYSLQIPPCAAGVYNVLLTYGTHVMQKRLLLF